jgi:hypothetical protein
MIVGCDAGGDSLPKDAGSVEWSSQQDQSEEKWAERWKILG